jgi:hypothetical protein
MYKQVPSVNKKSQHIVESKKKKLAEEEGEL